LKRKEDWTSAIALWELAAEHHALYAYEELAKYYEHQVKDLETALKWTQQALNVLNLQHLPAYEYHQWQEKFNHRQNRLLRRMGS
jgi:TPR repeat protein